MRRADSSAGFTIVFYPGICFTTIVPRINRGTDATGDRRKTARRAAHGSRRGTRLDAAAEKEAGRRAKSEANPEPPALDAPMRVTVIVRVMRRMRVQKLTL